MSLPSDWIDRLFARLAVRYGDKWQRMYPEIDMALVRADWTEVLGGMSGPALAYGLVNLPLDWPPNAMQFREICLRFPATKTEVFVLEGPKIPPEVLAQQKAEAIERLRRLGRELREPRARPGPRQAMANFIVESFLLPIDDEKLPPGMRQAALGRGAPESPEAA